MPTLTIDDRLVPFEPGETVLQAASRAGIAIPSLCRYPGIEPPASCYVCVVKIRGKQGLSPSCATLAEAGMAVESGTEEVRRYRRRALELLMSEHAGDCEAPCRRICPADLDIPTVARHLAARRLDAAVSTVRERLALPGVLGHICPAPCEKGCYRAPLDGAVSIRELHRSVAAAEPLSREAEAPRAAAPSGKRVVVIGAGPAGLSCAYYLARLGHACQVVDERDEPGGMLRYGVDRALLPLEVLVREITAIRASGVAFRMGCRIADQGALDELLQSCDAVVFATGMPAPERPWPFAVDASPKGIVTDAKSFATSRSGVFACGGAIAVCRLAVRAVGQGRLAAESAHRFLTHSGGGAAWSSRCDSHLGKPDEEELRQMAATDLASVPRDSCGEVRLPEPVVAAASRCMQCDCGKKDDCALRRYAQEYEINRDQYRTGARKRVARKRYPGGLAHEPGKCIDCGRCVGITAAEGIRPGLAFGNRGFDVAVTAPFGDDVETAMGAARDRCLAACPVGALWNLRRQEQAT